MNITGRVNELKAVIMAGGEGTRLRPLTCNQPKPMVPIMNKPVMDHIIELLKKHRITEIAVTLQYMPHVIQEYFGDGSHLGVNIHYFIEDMPLGTAGSVKNAEEFLNDTFVVISGDALTDIDLSHAIQYHYEKNAMATLILTKVDVPLEYGVVVTDADGRITRFLEKPSWSEVFSDTVNTGIYILSPEIFQYYRRGEMFDFSKDLFPMLLEARKPMYGFISNDYWCDIGDLAAYQQCHFDILEGKVKIKHTARQIAEKVWVEEGVVIGEQVKITGPVFIGRDTKLKNNVAIGPMTIIGQDNVIGEYSTLKRTILWKNCNVGRSVQLRGCTVCNKVNIKDNSSVFEQAVIGDETLIKENAIVKPGIKIWPSKVIESNTEINTNLIWGSKYSKALFGARGIAGEINVDITPEFASRIGAAFGALNKSNPKIAVSCDTGHASVMLKNSVIAGLLSAGAEIFDFGSQLLPITRAAIRFYGFNGGIHISTVSKENDSKLCIDFLNSKGANISREQERKLENAFIREDFSRCEAGEIKKVVQIHDYSSYYIRTVINGSQNKKMDYKIMAYVSSDMIRSVLESVMDALNCRVDIINRRIGNLSEVHDLSGEVKEKGYDLCAIIEDNGEKLILIDDKGRLITEDWYIALVSLITLKKVQNATVVVPISAPSVIEQMAEQYNGRVLRTKTSVLDVMNNMVSDITDDIMMNEQFILNFDAISSLVRVLDYMKTDDTSLSALVDLIPKFYMVKKEVECSWSDKGKVIRKIIEDCSGNKVELTEGVKIYQDGGWVLVLPDVERPMCKIIGEGYSEEFAESITDFMVDKVKKISNNHNI